MSVFPARRPVHGSRSFARVVEAGRGKEDRLAQGSYRALREQEERARLEENRERMKQEGAGDSYLPDFLR